MKQEMLMPQMGESITEATILKWRKSVGEEVKKDETILEISTDKVDSEIPAPATGVIVELVAKEGQVVPVKSVIAIIETDKAAVGDLSAAKSAAAPAPKAAEPTPTPKAAPQAAPKPVPAAQPVAHTAPTSMRSSSREQSTESAVADGIGVTASSIPTHVGEKFYSPLVRTVAAQHGISPVELASIPGSGSQGRITKEDVMNYVEYRGTGSAVTVAETMVAPAAKAQPAAPRLEFGPEGTKVVPFDNMRKRIAEHMVRSKATSPHVYSVAEVDVTNVAKWRAAKQKEFSSREGFKLSFTPFFLEAVVRGLVHVPQINAAVDGENLVYKKAVNLGCAVALGTTGLIVPVIKNADQLSFTGIARALDDLATRARDKKLNPDEVSGGSFTVTNVGTFGNIIGYPIINQPQLGILALGAIKKRPVVVDDAIAIRDIIYITLSYDHRVIDGSAGGQFLKFITDFLQGWDLNRPLA